MRDIERQAQLAREYAQILNVTGQRHASREALLFCEGIELAENPPASESPAPVAEPVPEVPALDVEPVAKEP
jgi:hypothetical protein